MQVVCVCVCMTVYICMNVWEYVDLQTYHCVFHWKWRQDFYVIDSDLQLCSLQERWQPSTHTHPFSAGVIDGYASPFGKSEEWKSLTALHSRSLQISLFPSLSLHGEPDPFVFCSLFALKSHHGSMQSNEPAQPERKAGGKTGRQKGRQTGRVADRKKERQKRCSGR